MRSQLRNEIEPPLEGEQGVENEQSGAPSEPAAGVQNNGYGVYDNPVQPIGMDELQHPIGRDQTSDRRECIQAGPPAFALKKPTKRPPRNQADSNRQCMSFKRSRGQGVGPSGLHGPCAVHGHADVVQPEEGLQFQLPLPTYDQKQGATEATDRKRPCLAGLVTQGVGDVQGNGQGFCPPVPRVGRITHRNRTGTAPTG